MSKIKKLISIILFSSLFANAPSSVIAMDEETPSNSMVLSIDEVNKYYENSRFNPVNLYKQICGKLNITKNKSDLTTGDKVRIIKEANKIIDEYVKNCLKSYHESSTVKFAESDKPNFETIMHNTIINFEKTGVFNSFAKSFILYLLSEYITFGAIIKVISYDEYNAKNDKTEKSYEAVILFSSNNCFGSAKDCIFNPIPFDTRNNDIWKKMILYPAKFNMEEYYLCVPYPNSEPVYMFKSVYSTKNTLHSGPIMNAVMNQIQNIALNIPEILIYTRNERSYVWPANMQCNDSIFLDPCEIIKEINKSAY